MTSNKDIYTTANLIIKEYGVEAANHADRRMRELTNADDVKGAAVWLQIGQAIHDLQKTSSGGKLH